MNCSATFNVDCGDETRCTDPSFLDGDSESYSSTRPLAFLVSAIKELGCWRLRVKSDNEPELQDDELAFFPVVEWLPKEVLVGDSLANGAAKQQRQIRTLKIDTESLGLSHLSVANLRMLSEALSVPYTSGRRGGHMWRCSLDFSKFVDSMFV